MSIGLCSFSFAWILWKKNPQFDFPSATYVAEDEALSPSPVPVFLYSNVTVSKLEPAGGKVSLFRSCKPQCSLSCQFVWFCRKMRWEWQGSACRPSLQGNSSQLGKGTSWTTKHWLSECKLRIHSCSLQCKLRSESIKLSSWECWTWFPAQYCYVLHLLVPNRKKYDKTRVWHISLVSFICFLLPCVLSHKSQVT